MQDVIQFGPLVKTLGLVMLTKPQIIPSIFKQVIYVQSLDPAPSIPRFGHVDPQVSIVINAHGAVP